MNITPIQTSYNVRQQQPAFTGKSRIFEPVERVLDKHAEAIANKYYVKFLTSDFAKWFVDKTKNVDNIATHMQVAGATLISAMYVTRTLKNDKLDKDKRKTLAINDALTWGLSTAGAYWADEKLGNWWSRVTTRFAANYLQKHPDSKNIELLGQWEPEKIYEMIENGQKIALDSYAPKREETLKALRDGELQDIKEKVTEILQNPESKEFKEYKEAVGKKHFEQIDEKCIEECTVYEHLKDWHKKVKMEPKHFEAMAKNAPNNLKLKDIKDLNVNLLKDKKLSTCIKGMGFLKSLLIVTLIYRYLVPVIVMKPANKLGAYLHKKNAEKQTQNNQIVKA